MKKLQFTVALALLAGVAGLVSTTEAARADSPRSAQVFLTAKGTADHLSFKGRVPFVPVRQPDEHDATIVVDPTHRCQTVEGIGGALTDASAETFYKLPKARQKEFLLDYYDPEKGIGYTLARTHINSCDFSSESYAYAATPGDKALKSFTVAHDLKYRIPFIRAVLALVPRLKIFASPWSPPAWMKTNHDMLHGGKLKPEYRSTWAQYYVRFIREYARQGIPIWGLTLQNEPLASQTWESCIWTADEERDFVKQYLGPALWRARLDAVHLMIWDHNRGLIYQQASTVLQDPDAARYVWGTAYHWYVGNMYQNVGRVHDAFPDKAVMFTEGCNGPYSNESVDDWKNGEEYGKSMINDFNNWAAGWCDWNVLLDEQGGPNHVGNYCFAPIHADTKAGTLHITNAYYYIGHFSKFVRPGARRIACTSASDDLLATAFVNRDGRVATIVMNPGDAAVKTRIWVSGQETGTELPPHSIATVVWH